MANYVAHIEGEVIAGVSLAKLKSDLKGAKKGDQVSVYINSVGGDVDEGFAMYDFLKGLNADLSTTVSGVCYSIATVPLMAADKSKRYMTPYSRLMIHNPWGQAMGDAKRLEQYVGYLKQQEDRLTKFYAANAGLSADELSDLMDQETYLDLSQAMALGFVGGEYEFKAVAKFNINEDTMEDKIYKQFKALLNSMLGRPDGAKAKDIPLMDGKVLMVEGAEDGDLIGKRAFVDGQPAPDGTHETAGGVKVTTQGGVVMAVQEAQPVAAPAPVAASDPEKEAMKAELEALKAQLASASAQLAAATEQASAQAKELEGMRANAKKINDMLEAANMSAQKFTAPTNNASSTKPTEPTTNKWAYKAANLMKDALPDKSFSRKN